MKYALLNNKNNIMITKYNNNNLTTYKINLL